MLRFSRRDRAIGQGHGPGPLTGPATGRLWGRRFGELHESPKVIRPKKPSSTPFMRRKPRAPFPPWKRNKQRWEQSLLVWVDDVSFSLFLFFRKTFVWRNVGCWQVFFVLQSKCDVCLSSIKKNTCWRKGWQIASKVSLPKLEKDARSALCPSRKWSFKWIFWPIAESPNDTQKRWCKWCWRASSPAKKKKQLSETDTLEKVNLSENNTGFFSGEKPQQAKDNGIKESCPYLRLST